jgi:hypothetical protein
VGICFLPAHHWFQQAMLDAIHCLTQHAPLAVPLPPFVCEQVEDNASSTELPAWERLSHMFTTRGGDYDHSSAALAVYRQEVMRGQDVSDGCRNLPLPPATPPNRSAAQRGPAVRHVQATAGASNRPTPPCLIFRMLTH